MTREFAQYANDIFSDSNTDFVQFNYNETGLSAISISEENRAAFSDKNIVSIAEPTNYNTAKSPMLSLIIFEKLVSKKLFATKTCVFSTI